MCTSRMGSRTNKHRSRRAKVNEAKRTKLRIRVPSSITSHQRTVSVPNPNIGLGASSGSSLTLPHPALTPSTNGSKGLLQLAPEFRLNIYTFLDEPPDLQIALDGSSPKSKWKRKHVKCLSSRHAPLLGTCRLLRKESLAYLLSITQLALLNGVRPRVRHDPRQHGFPLWQLCNIQHVAIDISRKMQFEFFSRLKTLTLLWPNKAIAIQTPATWRSGPLLGYLWSDGGAAAMTAIGTSEVRSSSHNWIQKLAARKKKRFSLQMQAIFGCRDQRGSKSNSLIVSLSNL